MNELPNAPDSFEEEGESYHPGHLEVSSLPFLSIPYSFFQIETHIAYIYIDTCLRTRHIFR